MALSTASAPENLRPGIRMWFGTAYENYDVKYDKMLDVKVPDDRAYEEDVMMSQLGLAKLKTQGAPVSYDQGQQIYISRYVHLAYGLGFVITREAMDDGIAIKLAEVFSKDLKLNMLRTREIICANVYNNAFNSGNKMDAGDGVSLGSNAHPTAAANFSNVPSTIATLSEASLEQAVIDIMAYTNNRGNLIMCKPEKLCINPALQFNAHRILESVLRPSTADNDVNAIKDMGWIKEIVVNPYLTSLTNWHIRTDQPGLVMFNRRDISLDDENEFDTENMKVKGIMRLSVGWSDPRAGYFVNA